MNPSSHHIFLAAKFIVTIFDSLRCKLRLQEPTLSMFSTIMDMVLGDARRRWCTHCEGPYSCCHSIHNLLTNHLWRKDEERLEG